MQHPAWILVIVGLVIAIIGGVWLVLPSIPWMGRLPGDIVIDQPNFKFNFPLTTCIIVSVVLTVIAWIVRYFSR